MVSVRVSGITDAVKVPLSANTPRIEATKGCGHLRVKLAPSLQWLWMSFYVLKLTLWWYCVEDGIVTRTCRWGTHTVQELGLHLSQLPPVLTVRSPEQWRPLVVEGEDPSHVTAAAQRVPLVISSGREHNRRVSGTCITQWPVLFLVSMYGLHSDSSMNLMLLLDRSTTSSLLLRVAILFPRILRCCSKKVLTWKGKCTKGVFRENLAPQMIVAQVEVCERQVEECVVLQHHQWVLTQVNLSEILAIGDDFFW